MILVDIGNLVCDHAALTKYNYTKYILHFDQLPCKQLNAQNYFCWAWGFNMAVRSVVPNESGGNAGQEGSYGHWTRG